MRSILRSLTDSVKYLNLIRTMPDQFDRDERRLVLQAVVIGVVVWAIVFALKSTVHFVFHELIHWLEHALSPFLLFAPLLVGALLVATIVRFRSATLHYRDADGHIHELLDVEGDGLERAISLYFSSEPTFERAVMGEEGVDVRWKLPTFSLVIRKFIATLITLGSGGSGGLEASVTLIGESAAAGLFKPRPAARPTVGRVGAVSRFWNWWKSTNTDDLQVAQLCGIAAAVSTLLGAPFAAAFFAIEVMYRRRPVVERLVHALIAALTAFFLMRLVAPDSTALFHVDEVVRLSADLRYYAVLIAVGIVISFVSVYFSQLRNSFDEGFHRRQPNVYQRHLLGAVVTGVVAIGVYYLLPVLVDLGAIPADAAKHPLTLVLGAGEEAIDSALAGELVLVVAVIALFAKMIATLATVGSGGSAGLLVPSIFFGTMVAAGASHLTQIPAQTLIIPAMTASLVSIVNVPLAAILLPVELFGTQYMPPALVMLVVCSILAHRNSIYRTQRERIRGREILPGYSTQRVHTPADWIGKSLVELDLRQQFNVSVIGLIEGYDDEGIEPHVHLNPDPEHPLSADDILVVIGSNEQLKTFGNAINEMVTSG